MTRVSRVLRATLGVGDQDPILKHDVLTGLSGTPKQIPSKYFYDACGSQLFEKICELPEYYLTRCELAILDEHAHDIAHEIGSRKTLVEYGSGSGIKTRLLLNALIDPVAYVPVEISEEALSASATALRREFPSIECLPICADFTRPFDIPMSKSRSSGVIVFFSGSTLGNFEHAQAIELLKKMRKEIGPDGAVLIGIDLKKDVELLEAAYNDRAGVTAQFTLNLLTRLNRELSANFDLKKFRHRAVYDASAGRIETHIISRYAQAVDVAGERFHFHADEPILVEYSCKYSLEDFEQIALSAGMFIEKTWLDRDRYFSIQLLRGC